MENIQKRIRLNQVVYDVSEIRERYQNEKEKTEIDFELKLEVEAWQVESETTNGIYLLKWIMEFLILAQFYPCS